MPRKRVPRLLAGYTHHNKVRLIHGGREYFTTIVELIDSAKTILHLQTLYFRCRLRQAGLYRMPCYAPQPVTWKYSSCWTDMLHSTCPNN